MKESERVYLSSWTNLVIGRTTKLYISITSGGIPYSDRIIRELGDLLAPAKIIMETGKPYGHLLTINSIIDLEYISARISEDLEEGILFECALTIGLISEDRMMDQIMPRWSKKIGFRQ